jgi:hypothetical protein
MRSGVQRAACGCSLANFRVRRDALEMSWSARSTDRRVCGVLLLVEEGDSMFRCGSSRGRDADRRSGCPRYLLIAAIRQRASTAFAAGG